MSAAPVLRKIYYEVIMVKKSLTLEKKKRKSVEQEQENLEIDPNIFGYFVYY